MSHLTQSQSATVTVLLTKDNVGVASLTSSDITVQYYKSGDVSPTVKTLSGGDPIDIGNGLYRITFTGPELDTLGSFIIRITGATIDTYVKELTVVAAEDATTTISLDTCVISGHVFDVQGNPATNATVNAVIINMPAIEQNKAFIADTYVSVKTKANGEFFLTLIRNADVQISIPFANYKRQLIVPNQTSVALKDIV